MPRKSKNHTIDNLWRDITTYVLRPSLDIQYPENCLKNLETQQNQLQQLIRQGVQKLSKSRRTKTNVEVLLVKPNVEVFKSLLEKLKIFSNDEIREDQLLIAQNIVRNKICLTYKDNQDRILRDYLKSDKQQFKILVKQIIQSDIKQPISEDKSKNTKKKEKLQGKSEKNKAKKQRFNLKKILNQNYQRESQVRSHIQGSQIQTEVESKMQLVTQSQSGSSNQSILMQQFEEPSFESFQVEQISSPNFSFSDSRNLVIQADKNIDHVEGFDLNNDDSLIRLSNIDFLSYLNLDQSETEKFA